MRYDSRQHELLQRFLPINGPIDDANTALWRVLTTQYRTYTIVIGAISLILCLNILVIPLGISLFMGYCSVIFWRIREEFMREFAKEHGFSYAEDAPISSLAGTFLHNGRSPDLTHIISGIPSAFPTRLFHASYIIKSGKHSKTYPFTVLEFSFEKTVFPPILLQSKTMDFFSSTYRTEEISLEESYKTSFTLHALPGYEIEVLQIFTHDFLQLLITHGSHLSIEFADNKVYLYDDRYILNKKALEELLEVGKKVIEHAGPLLHRLHDDFAALHPYYGTNQESTASAEAV